VLPQIQKKNVHCFKEWRMRPDGLLLLQGSFLYLSSSVAGSILCPLKVNLLANSFNGNRSFSLHPAKNSSMALSTSTPPSRIPLIALFSCEGVIFSSTPS
jgi:hypothetical protein